MKRDIKKLTDTEFDIVIIGGGIYGLTSAWDAELRGLKVAVIEKQDFGQATSSATLKLIHGGLRYLQHLNFARMRVSINARHHMLYMAPHLVHPIEFVMPCYGHVMKGPEAMFAALMVNDIMSFDRNKGLDKEKHIPCGRIISREECLRRIPGIKTEGLTAGAIFYDAQMYNSERLSLAFAKSAAKQGAVLVNYAEAIGFDIKDRRIQSVKVQDLLSDQRIDVRGKMVLNMTGPWSDIVEQYTKTSTPDKKVVRSKGIQLITRSISDVAFPIESKQKDKAALIKRGGRNFFVTPWRGCSIIGTTDTLYEGSPDNFAITETDIQTFLDDINASFPTAKLKREEVYFWVGGMRPMGDEDTDPDIVKASHKYQIRDHHEMGMDNLVSVVGVKYTISREIAEKVVDSLVKRLGMPKTPSRSARTHLVGGDIGLREDYVKHIANVYRVTEKIAKHLVYNYGSEVKDIMALAEKEKIALCLAGSEEVLGAEILFAIREEMALSLADVVLRRTDLGSAGHPGSEALEACATIMAEELGWSKDKKASEIELVNRLYQPPGKTSL